MDLFEITMTGEIMTNEIEAFPGELTSLRRKVTEIEMIPNWFLNDALVVRLLRQCNEVRQQISDGTHIEETAAECIAVILEEAAFDLARQRRQTDHFVNEWSEVCNENQVLLNTIVILRSQLLHD